MPIINKEERKALNAVNRVTSLPETALVPGVIDRLLQKRLVWAAAGKLTLTPLGLRVLGDSPWFQFEITAPAWPRMIVVQLKEKPNPFYYAFFLSNDFIIYSGGKLHSMEIELWSEPDKMSALEKAVDAAFCERRLVNNLRLLEIETAAKGNAMGVLLRDASDKAVEQIQALFEENLEQLSLMISEAALRGRKGISIELQLVVNSVADEEHEVRDIAQALIGLKNRKNDEAAVKASVDNS